MMRSTTNRRVFGAATLMSFVCLMTLHEFPPPGLASPQPPGTSEPKKDSAQSFMVEYYYKARWGFADEFIRLFRKNHYPVLRKQVEAGRILRVSMVKPRYHATEDGRWDYKVTIVYKDVGSAFAPSNVEESIKKELFPDQQTFHREEQRRFEILVAHWDIPVEDVELAP